MKKILIIISIVFFVFTVVQIGKSFGVFETKIENESELEIAKWNIYVNDYDLNGNNQTFYVDEITYQDQEGNSVDYFSPGVTGSFLIVIDPKNTETAFTYSLSIDLSQNDYEQIQIDEIKGMNGLQLTEQNGVYSHLVTLPSIESGIKDTIQVTFHWEMDEKYNDSDSSLGQDPDSQFKIPISIQFEQYVN